MRKNLTKYTCYKLVRYDKKSNKFFSSTFSGTSAIEYKLYELQRAPRNTMGFFVYKSLEDLNLANDDCKTQQHIEEIKNPENFEFKENFLDLDYREYRPRYYIMECKCSKFWKPSTILNTHVLSDWRAGKCSLKYLLASRKDIKLVKNEKNNEFFYTSKIAWLFPLTLLKNYPKFKPYCVYFIRPVKIFIY